jgi:hypothetical protein
VTITTEHPRLAAAIAVGLVILALASAAAGAALGGAKPGRGNDQALRAANSQPTAVHQQLQTAEAQNARLYRQVLTVTVLVARLRRERQEAISAALRARERVRALSSSVHHHKRR